MLKILFKSSIVRMAALLAKFRIEYSDLIVISNLSSKPPSNHTVTWFDGLVRHLVRREEAIGMLHLNFKLGANDSIDKYRS